MKMNEDEQKNIKHGGRSGTTGENLSKEGIRISEEKNVVMTKMEEKDIKERRWSSGELEENNFQKLMFILSAYRRWA